MSLEEIQETLDLSSKPVKQNAVIVPYDKLNKPLLHISHSLQKELIPNISKRAGSSEDNTMPRVHMSPYLIGCIFGYASIHNDIMDLPVVASFKGRYYIYSVDFEFCIKPNNKLVYDQSNSDEHWLVTYNKETVKYKPTYTNEMLFESLTTTVVRGKHLLHELTFNLNIIQPDMWLDDKTNVKSGYYKMKVEFYDQANSRDWIIRNVKRISKLDYETCRADVNNVKNKLPGIAKESLICGVPSFKNW